MKQAEEGQLKVPLWTFRGRLIWQRIPLPLIRERDESKGATEKDFR